MKTRLEKAQAAYNEAVHLNKESIDRVNSKGPRSFGEMMNDPEETPGRRRELANACLKARLELEAARAEVVGK